ncbi:PEP-CTERM sorting domain-containing protein [Verrucomicrobiaceae bacterium N1E253]|uniref:PEP-CTERM sorting domain-containing protein n=1 Tax=Oceaniferula marina TaxID=2748318 RepID=A0A851GGT2_9BACT|nr:PEP-CTERM sorting domain-containing protein [Oceaniferula marina]NWK54347.1 PEP-CTERM sorting domain-containing protein [Oceaniferula marina]
MLKISHFFIVTCATALLLGNAVQAANVMAVTGNQGDGNFDPNSFYEINTDNGRSTKIGSATVTPNQLAYDVSSNNYYYMDHNGSNFYRFDITNGTQHLIGDLIDVGMPSGKTGSGGGDFYNGRYYYTPETGTEGLYVISFNGDGSQIVSHTPIAPSNLSDHSDLFDGSGNAGLGDFGDFAIDSDTGLMYGSSRMSKNGQSYYAFWTIDLTDPNYEMAMLNDNISDVYQMAFDENNVLWANRWNSGGDLYELNKSDGTISDTATLRYINSRGRWRAANGDFYDMASTGVREGIPVIPEPSSFAFMSTAAFLFLRRRRKPEAVLYSTLR